MCRLAVLVTLAPAVLLLASACGGDGQPAVGTIAFLSDRDTDGVGEIYTVAADATDLTRLTTTPASSPEGGAVTGVQGYDWSPDGKKIVFSSDQDGNLEIYVMNADGSGQTRLTEDPAVDTLPRWSPDGKRISFISKRDGNTEIYVMNADGSGQTRLTEDPADDFFGLLGISPDPWSPDGQRIAFTRGTFFQEGGDPNLDIFVMNADGSGQTRLTEGTPALFFGWSSESMQIVFLSLDTEGEAQIHVMNADGSGQTRLTDNLPADHIPGFPAWSPDGRRIAFSADRDGQDVLYIMNADGSEQAPLTMGQCDGLLGISWSPDSQRIAFTRGCDFEGVEVWIINADGTGLARVAYSPAFFPAWSPVQ